MSWVLDLVFGWVREHGDDVSVVVFLMLVIWVIAGPSDAPTRRIVRIIRAIRSRPR